MKGLKLKYLAIALLFSCYANSQVVDSHTKIIHPTSLTEVTILSIPNNPPPTDSDFIIMDDSLMKIIFTYITYDNFFGYRDSLEKTEKTLIVYPILEKENSTDSLLIVNSYDDLYTFIKRDKEWEIQRLKISSTSTTIRRLKIGQTSELVLKLLHKKTKKKIVDGQIWVTDKEGKNHLELTFSKGKLILIQL